MGVSYGKLMMWFFLLSDAFTFSALLITYGLVRSAHPAYNGEVDAFVFSPEYWPIPEKVFEAIPFFHGVEAPLVFVGIMTFILIMSSVTMVLVTLQREPPLTRIFAPGFVAPSTMATRSAGLRSFVKMAVASPAAPAPTTATSRSGRLTRDSCRTAARRRSPAT